MNFPSPVIERGMGRPSLNVEETKVRLAAGVKDRIITLVGKQRMAAFIREAVERALSEQEVTAPPDQPRPNPKTPSSKPD